MKIHTVTTVLVVLSCIAAVGVASTTLETTFETTPDEAVDLDYRTVPISPDDAGRLKRAVTGDDGSEQQRPAGADGERDRSVDAQDDRGSRSEQSNPEGGEARDQSGGGGDDQSSKSASRSPADSGPDGVTENWLDRLLDLLASWLPYLVLLAVLVAVATLLARHRDRIRRLLRTPPAERGGREAAREPAPSNAVERAWLSVLAAADVEDPWRRTPAECASAAVESGLDPEGVERLRSVFEEVRYGNCELTEARRRRMEQGLSRLDLRGVER